jgi:hypothetical protein
VEFVPRTADLSLSSVSSVRSTGQNAGVPVHTPSAEALLDGSRRAMKMVAYHAIKLEEAADRAAKAYADGERRTARTDASEVVQELNELDRLARAAMRLARASLDALDDDLTRTGDDRRSQAERRAMPDRRRFDRRRGDRRGGLDELPPEPPGAA